MKAGHQGFFLAINGLRITTKEKVYRILARLALHCASECWAVEETGTGTTNAGIRNSHAPVYEWESWGIRGGVRNEYIREGVRVAQIRNEMRGNRLQGVRPCDDAVENDLIRTILDLQVGNRRGRGRVKWVSDENRYGRIRDGWDLSRGYEGFDGCTFRRPDSTTDGIRIGVAVVRHDVLH